MQNYLSQNTSTTNTDYQIIFVSDFFIPQLSGGAELTNEAIIKSSPYSIKKILSADLNEKMIDDHREKYWIFANTALIDYNLLDSIYKKLDYSIINYDYRLCKHRSYEKHGDIEKRECDCSSTELGKKIATFSYASHSIFWMSQRQLDLTIKYDTNNKIKHCNNIILSSVFDKKDLLHIKKLRNLSSKVEGTCAYLSAATWIKASQENLDWIKDHNLQPVPIANMQYHDALNIIASCSDFVYMPKGSDTCPRMVIEAKLLGCRLHLNNYVQHHDEPWFQAPLDDTETYLENSPKKFWGNIHEIIKNKSRVSGYTQTYNCISQHYPWKECITSLLGFCDEVIVVDGGSTDGTWEDLQAMQKENDRIVIKQIKRDWENGRFALYDGMQKAEARTLCKYGLLWQSDVDEIVHPRDYDKIKNIIKTLPKNVNLLSLPIIEYWGSYDKVRVDVNPWKWRLSRNKKNITHGINKEHRAYDEEGNLYSLGSDGCDYIDSETFERINSASFYTKKIEDMRRLSLMGDKKSVEKYEEWFNTVVKSFPTVYHYSWYSISRKIKSYRKFWTKFWKSLYDEKCDGTNNDNVLFGKDWSEVTDDEINEAAKMLKNDFGGWVFNRKIEPNNPTPWVKISMEHPVIMNEWTAEADKH